MRGDHVANTTASIYVSNIELLLYDVYTQKQDRSWERNLIIELNFSPWTMA